MKKRPISAFRPRLSEKSGIALILTLAIIALVTLLLIAFVTSMRVENTASKSFNDLVKARELAQGAVDQAVATIRQATTERTAIPVSTYVTFPGVIWTNYNGAVGPAYLFSAPNSVFSALDPTYTNNLNSGFWITGQNPVEFINETDPQIFAGWLYVAEDGTVGPPPLVAGHGALVGRFAYWVDDEASKINLNTAGTPPAPPVPDYGTSVSNDVDLSVLLPGLNIPAAIVGRQAPAGNGFTTIEEVKLADPTVNADSDFNMNRFYLSTYSNDANYPGYADDLNTFELPRLVLANIHDTSPSDSDILGTAGAGISNAFTYLSAPALATMLSASATPAAFSDKYTPNGLKQVIANIIAYQINPTVTPPPDSSPLGFLPSYLGLAKTPYINEVQVSYAISGTAPNITVQRTISVELFYMYDGTYTSAPGALGNEQIRLNNLPTAGGAFSAAAGPINIPASTPFASGTYTVFTYIDPTIVTLAATTPIPTQTALDGPTQIEYIRRYPPIPVVGTFHRLDYSQMMLLGASLDPATPTVYQGAQAGDPCVNDQDGDWEKYSTTTAPAGTLGSRNVWLLSNPFSLGAGPAAYPFGADMTKAVIRTNAMQSIGELGYIHRPEPFKHVTLQPGGGNSLPSQIPDWAMLDLFTVATPPTAGRININSFINPGFPNANIRRLVPLKALLNSESGTLSPATVAQLAQQIYDDTPRSVGVDTYGMNNGRDGIFDTIGEICEAPGVADNAALSEADREAIVRRIANIITVRSSTFTIWVMAQTIKQPPTIPPHLGTYMPSVDLITGEVRAQAVVERYESTPGVAGSVPRFRTRYFRYLYN